MTFHLSCYRKCSSGIHVRNAVHEINLKLLEQRNLNCWHYTTHKLLQLQLTIKSKLCAGWQEMNWKLERDIFIYHHMHFSVRGGTVGWGTALQAGSLRVQFPIMSLTSFRPYCGPGVQSASNRNEYQEYFLGGKGGWWEMLTILPPSYADCLEIWESQPPGTLSACPDL